MKKITDKEYEAYEKYKMDKIYGRILTPEALSLICRANNYDPYLIGKDILEVLAKIERR